jgi:catechol 2,3-dioxygenase-like lactoylglutathione lyase family enzyme
VNDSPALRLDHLVIGVPDLEAAASSLSAVLGHDPSWRGRHPAYGTANVLYRLEDAYLELLAPEPGSEADTAWTRSLRTFLETRGEGLFSIALGTRDAAASAARARAAGLDADEPLEGEGINLLDGARRRWANARIAPESTRGTRAFLIQHLSPAEALPPSPARHGAGIATAILGASIESSDAEGARRMWREAFGLSEAAAGDGWRFQLENADLLLWPGVGEAEATDRWRHLLLHADSITALADRLDAERIAFEQGDFPEGYGVRVDCCGAELLFLESP